MITVENSVKADKKAAQKSESENVKKGFFSRIPKWMYWVAGAAAGYFLVVKPLFGGKNEVPGSNIASPGGGAGNAPGGV